MKPSVRALARFALVTLALVASPWLAMSVMPGRMLSLDEIQALTSGGTPASRKSGQWPLVRSSALDEREHPRIKASLVRDTSTSVTQRTTCHYPTYDTATNVVIDHVGPGALSTAWVGFEWGPETSFVQLSVRAGSSPLRIWILDHLAPVVWKIVGDTDAVAEVVVLGSSALQVGRHGIVGLDPAKVRFVTSPSCQPLSDVRGGTPRHRFRDALANQFGIKDAVPLLADVSTMLPTGAKGIPVPASDFVTVRSKYPRLLANANTAFPNGIVEVDPAAVVSPSQVGRYEVLPRNAGLAEASDHRISPDPSDRKLYRVRGETTLPPNLCGPYALTFSVEPGVPYPRGEKCSCVLTPMSPGIRGGCLAE